jgi:2'-5' RNA ligase
VSGDDRLRLFCALRLPDVALDRVVEWQGEHLQHGRIVPRDDLHVTLAFLGSRPRDEVPAIAAELRAAAGAAGSIELEPMRYRESRSVGMLVLADEGGRAGALAADLQARLERLAVYRPEGRAWLPHLTVIRFRSRPRLHPGLPKLGRFAPSDAAAYLSRLSPSGAQYDVLEAVPLGG